MGKFKIGIKFDKKFLSNLTKEENSGVEKQTAKHHLSLHPTHLNNFNKSVKDILNEGIAKYNKSLSGILLGYSNIKLLSNMGKIINDSACIHYDLLVDFFVFKPEIDKELRGTVCRKSKDHVGVLVYNAFNVSLPKPKEEDDWLGTFVNAGDEVLFKITFIDLSSYLPYIRGELISIVSINEVDKGVKTKVKNTKIVFNLEEDLEIPVAEKSELEIESESKVKHKKSKKRKKNDSNEDLSEQLDISNSLDDSVQSNVDVVKKKKRRVSFYT